MFRIVFIFLLFTPLLISAQITPKEGSELNYRIIGFSFPEREKTTSYKLQIAEGNYTSDNDFERHIVVTNTGKKNRIVAEVPAFGKQYTWRVIYEDKRSKHAGSGLQHFSTLMCADVNEDSVRMRITSDSGKYKDQYVFVDCNKVLYDMKGKPVWFYPKIENHNPANIRLRDLTTTPFGTITAIVNGRIYETNYSGDILWQGPENNETSLDTVSPDRGYHHEFTRLANGHYMAMGFEEPYWELPGQPDSMAYVLWASKIKKEGSSYYQKMFFGTITEYDEQGNVVWKWSDAEFFKTSDLRTRMTTTKLYDINDTHANAFYLDEKKKNLYISYRGINRILQVHYPDRKVLHTYGMLYSGEHPKDRYLRNGLFCGQHACRISHDGYLYMFNNNSCHRRVLPTVLMLKEPQPGNDTLEKVWETECTLDDPFEVHRQALFGFGGNAEELADGSFFVCMGGSYGKLFITNRDKNIAWSSQPEKWDSETEKWIKDGVYIAPQMKEGSYRAHIISRKELESLIWGEPVGK